MTKTRKILEDAAIFALLALIVLLIVFASCQKDETQNTNELKANTGINYALPPQVSTFGVITPCDSIIPVAMGAELKVVSGTIFKKIATKGKFKGKRVWMAELCSDQFIDAFSFINECNLHRCVVADTIEITDTTLFYVSRIKN